MFWLLKAFACGASLLIILIVVTNCYCKLEKYLIDKHGEDAMKLLWAFIIMSFILGCLILRIIEVM